MDKTIIGVLAGHEDPTRHNQLVEILNDTLSDESMWRILEENYQFMFTGGTFARIVAKTRDEWNTVRPEIAQKLVKMTTVLPGYLEGGVVLLSYMIVQRHCTILWAFLMPSATSLHNPDNGALLRLCDICHTKTLMNRGSVEWWLKHELKSDEKANPQPFPVVLEIPRVDKRFIPSTESYEGISASTIKLPSRTDFHYPDAAKDRTIALIAHDGMKDRMVDFVVDNERQLGMYKAVLATGTTGALVRDATRALGDKLHRYYSGPKGGDIEIATEILAGLCHDVIFFVDPINPHPHMDDIRVVIGSCMIQEYVQMLKNERHARAWISHVN